jgi:hypothetical protein
MLYAPVTKVAKVRTTVGISTDDHIEAMLQGLVRRSDGPQPLLLPEDECDDASYTIQRRAARAIGSGLSSPEK